MDDRDSGEETKAADDDVNDDSMLCGKTGVTVAEERDSDDKVDGASDNGALLTEGRDTEKVDDAGYDIGAGKEAGGRRELEQDDSCAFCPSVGEIVVVSGSKCEVLMGESVTDGRGGNSMAAGDDRGMGAREGG